MEEPSCNNLSFNLQLDFPSQLDFLRVLDVRPVCFSRHLCCPTAPDLSYFLGRFYHLVVTACLFV